MRNWRWNRRRPRAACAEEYRLAASGRVPAADTPVNSIDWMVVDSETEGFQVGRDRILSFSVVPVSGLRIRLDDIRSWVIHQPGTGIGKSTEIHGLLPCDIREGVEESRWLAELLPVIGNRLVVGHHVGFDLMMLGECLKRHHALRLRNPHLDTGVLARAELESFGRSGYPNQPMPTLDELCSDLDLAPVARHTAEGDAFTTAQLFLLILARMRRRLGREVVVGDLPLRRTRA